MDEQTMIRTYQRECQGMSKDGTLTPERQFLAMMMFLPQSYIEKQLKNKMKKFK
tara:strand:+ start:5000 stop:5161 length:162 start_codon:yes stop_codon:yes gene_type:complete